MRDGENNDRIRTDYGCRLGWGRTGAMAAAGRDDIIVIVDVLSFTTSVAVAVNRGAFIYPCRMEDDPYAMAAQIGGTAAVRRQDVPSKGPFSLSPVTYERIDAGRKVVVASPNGATCSACAAQTDFVLAGALVNASAVGGALSELISRTGRQVSVIACGEIEQLPDDGQEMRWALEDYLGAGAIISQLACSKSADARVCEAAFLQSRDALPALIRECQSGRELIERGFGEDVDIASRLDILDSVPILRGGRFTGYTSNRNLR